MRKYLAILLAALVLLGSTGCGNASSNAPAPTEVPSEAPVTDPPSAETIPTEPTEPPVTEPELTGYLVLSVAQITFSVVGESEDICVGTALRDYIVWESADESIITVEDGVLTAVGVGTTTVTAQYGDQYAECIAGCLAETPEDLKLLKDDVLRSPKRIPPVLENPPLEYFEDAALMGDSITYILFQYETIHGTLGNPLFLSRGGTGLNGLVMRYKNIYYQGRDMNIEDIIAACGKTKIFIMLGQNDLGYRTIDEVYSSWDTFVERVREKAPDAELYIQTAVYEWHPSNERNSRNEKIKLYNERLIDYCAENGLHYVDIQQYVEDHTGRMATIYSLDRGIHLNEAGCIVWMNALNNYAYLQMIGGTNE